MRSEAPAWFPGSSTLWVANLGNERMSPEHRHRSGVQFAVGRMLWFLRPDDVCLLPGRLDDEFVDYVRQTMRPRLDVSQVRSLDVPVLDQQVLRSTAATRELAQIRLRGPRTALAYLHDRATIHLLDQAGFSGPGTTSFMREGGAEALNSKAQFRLLAATHGWPVPQGRTAATTQDFVEGVTALLEGGGRVIAKTDTGVGGLGNQVLTATPSDGGREHQGALSTVQVDTEEALVEVAHRFGLRTTHAPRGQVVVERYVEDATPVFAEYHLDGQNGSRPHRLLAGRIRTDEARSVLSGVEALASTGVTWMQEFLEHADHVTAQVEQMGYRGLINVDGILTPDGRCYLNEVNGRMGGSTHIDVIGHGLIGAGWNTNHTAVTHFGPCDLTLPQVEHRLLEAGLHWPAPGLPGPQGVLVSCIGGPLSPVVEIMALAPSTTTARTLIGSARAALQTDATTQNRTTSGDLR